MPKIIETTSNQFFRVVDDRGAQFNCVPVKRVKGGFSDKAKARHMLVNKAYILNIIE